MAERKRSRVLRGALIGLGLLVVVIVAAGAIGWASFDPNAWKPRIAAAVKRATGRDLALSGPLSLTPSLVPTITAENVALANIANGSRPEMATVQRLRLRVALLPLLSRRVVIEALTLERPDILLERNADGTPNWILRPEVSGAKLAEATPPSPHAATTIELRALTIENGVVTWRDRRGRFTRVGVPHFAATADTITAPLHLDGALSAHGVPIAVTADAAPLDALLQGTAAPPWFSKLHVAALGGEVAATAEPAPDGHYAVALGGNFPDLSQLDRIFPHARLPALHDVSLSLHLAGAAGLPEPSALKLHIGAGDLGAVVPGLQVRSLDLTGAGMDAPAQLDFQGSLNELPIAIGGRLGPAAALLPLANRSFDVDLAARAAGATLAAKGKVANPRRLAGIDLALTGQAPDLALLSPLAGRPLPKLTDLAVQARLADRPGGAALQGLSLTGAQADLAGALQYAVEHGRPTVRADLTSRRLDLDALQAAMPPPPPAPPPLQPAPPSPPPPAPHPARLIPETKIPVGVLREADGDVSAKIALLRMGGIDYRNVVAHLVLTGGNLAVAPIAGDTPGGPAQGALEIEAAGAVPSVGLMLHAPAIAVAPLLAALHMPADASGTVMLDADLHGTGDTVRALAGTASGRFGLAMVGGQVDNALLTTLFGKVLNSAHLPAELAGHTDIRCFALRLDATNGLAKVSAFTLDTSRLGLTGTGTVNLADEALALELRPVLRIGGNGVAVPVRVTGTLAAPEAALAAMEGGRVGAVIGALGGMGQAENCGPALSLARHGAAGPAPPPPAPHGGFNPGDLLKLFRKKG